MEIEAYGTLYLYHKLHIFIYEVFFEKVIYEVNGT
jgi:hypothetical protein